MAALGRHRESGVAASLTEDERGGVEDGSVSSFVAVKLDMMRSIRLHDEGESVGLEVVGAGGVWLSGLVAEVLDGTRCSRSR
jgi:hypothetical protein